MRRIFLFLCIFTLFVLSSSIFAEIPRVINYQGKLLDSTKQPVPDGVYKLTFNIYDVEGTLKWTEVHEEVTVASGIFQVLIGGFEPLYLPFTQPYLLGIKVGNDPVLEPLMRLTSAAYSLNSDRVQGYGVSESPTPNTLLPLDATGKIPASALPSSSGTSGDYLRKNSPDTSRATSAAPLLLVSNLGNGDGLNGRSTNGDGISGRSENRNGTVGWTGASAGSGVLGFSTSGRGVVGRSDNNNGVVGWTGASDKSGVYGHSVDGIGVKAISDNSNAVHAHSSSTNEWTPTIYGQNVGTGDGIYGWSQNRHGIFGVTYSSNPNHAGIYAVNNGAGYAARFDGTAMTKVLEITGGSDLSEQFEIRDHESGLTPSPGMIVSIDPEEEGGLVVSREAYDRRVAGIISGAGGVQPGMLMGQKGSKADGSTPVALTGRVYCWVDASYGAIQPGDLLTTSDAPGHAMKVTDYTKAQGAILGKAMSSLEQGRGLVLVLVTLQ